MYIYVFDPNAFLQKLSVPIQTKQQMVDISLFQMMELMRTRKPFSTTHSNLIQHWVLNAMVDLFCQTSTTVTEHASRTPLGQEWNRRVFVSIYYYRNTIEATLFRAYPIALIF